MCLICFYVKNEYFHENIFKKTLLSQALNASSFTKKFVKLQQAQKEREDQQYPYSPTGSDDETPETNVPGEPPSILRGPGENTLRKNFQAIQVSNMAILTKFHLALKKTC